MYVHANGVHHSPFTIHCTSQQCATTVPLSLLLTHAHTHTLHTHAHAHAHAHTHMHTHTHTHTQSHPPASANEKQVESYCSVLNCLEKCLAKVGTCVRSVPSIVHVPVHESLTT